MYLQKENITKICFPSPFESTSVNINNYIFAICLDFTINALFYTDDQLSSRYKNRGLSFGQDLLRSLPVLSWVAVPQPRELLVPTRQTNHGYSDCSRSNLRIFRIAFVCPLRMSSSGNPPWASCLRSQSWCWASVNLNHVSLCPFLEVRKGVRRFPLSYPSRDMIVPYASWPHYWQGY